MNETGKFDSILKKSYEISYALYRVAANISEKSFGEKLFGKAIELIGFAADGNYAAMQSMLPGVEILIRFGMDVNSIAIQNADVLFLEIGNLKAEIFGRDADKVLAVADSPKAKEIDLSDIFKTKNADAKIIENNADDLEETKIEIEKDDADPIMPVMKDSGSGQGQIDYVPEIRQSATIRQSAILDRIRQTGNCRLADIQAILPECSERTIRYDLESLVEQNSIERVGIGGRGVYYKARK